ncbi:MAG: DUF3465 domain-containing protein [Candidatus Eremiobacteraeota bacterium]|nr:DUF3465 domain-containing protein [Candidatus Eremiobacteraeota bacterium]
MKGTDVLASLGIASLLGALGCGLSGSPSDGPNGAVYDAWRSGRSHTQVTASGSVVRVLGLSHGPSGAHEGFLLHLRGSAGRGLTVRVEDNVDVTGPLPLTAGADVEVRGEYIYDALGGIIHYTHLDPRGRHAAGYVRIGDKVYQ